MMKLQFVNDQGEIQKEREIRGGSYLLLYNSEFGIEYDVTHFKHMHFDEKHILKQLYKKNAMDLVKKYERHLSYVNPHRIAFMIDAAWEPSEKASKNSTWKIDIKKSPLWFSFLTDFDYMVLMRQYWIEKWSRAQINAAIMSQLLRINTEDGSVLKYSEDDNNKMIATFGVNYLEPETIIRDLLEEQIAITGFREASGQITIDEVLAEQVEGGDHDVA